ncbi:succinate dehydrogenase, partial [bacterium AH-315-M05]|nr:succinate dehydrogenase [bacterium AH-315-M05]
DGEFGVGVGSIVLLINPILLGGYTFGCHSFRHLMGGRLDCYSCGLRAKASHKSWKFVTMLNERHQFWAWISLFWVGFADVYVRLVSMGVITDYNTWGI